MRHSINVMFGKASKKALLNLHTYLEQYGYNDITTFISSYLCVYNDKNQLIINNAIAKKNNNAEISVELDNDNSFVSEINNREISIGNFFRDLWSKKINIKNPGDYKELLITMYIPLYEEKIWSQVKELLEIITNNNLQIDVDIVGFYADIAPVLCVDDEKINTLPILEFSDISKRIIKEISKYKNSSASTCLKHLFVIQNEMGGVSLNLDAKSLTRVLGQFTYACVENYHDIIGFNITNKDFYTFGISSISLDRYYFFHYLLSEVYLYLIDKEQLLEDKVDINKVSVKAKSIIGKRLTLMSEIFEKELNHVDKELNDVDKDKIKSTINPIIDKKVRELTDDLDNFIKDNELSIPEKKAILAVLLGEDDDLFKNIEFADAERLILMDLEREALKFYLRNNNLLVANKDLSTYASLSKDNINEDILEELKSVRNKIRECASSIRRIEKENEELGIQQITIKDAKKVMIEDGLFEYGDSKYKLLSDDDIGEPLKDEYVPHEVTSKGIDLRDKFTSIKDQGSQGSCLSHAITSIFEYMLKQNNDSKPDLSEAFLYYNARLKANNQDEDSGSRLDYSMDSLVEFGICTEALCEYDQNIFNVKPSDEAYKDAESRKVKEVLRVALDVTAIKSALQDGHPVGISVKLTDKFGKGNRGFIETPSDEEIAEMQKVAYNKKKHSSHSMVICGFSDEYEFFIVRNSWGKAFGDKGYCYMSYTYFENEILFNQAYIIKEITTYKSVQIIPKKFTFNLNLSDIGIKYEINNILLNLSRRNLNDLEKDYRDKQISYEFLRSQIKLPTVQGQIIEGSEKRLDIEIKKEEDYKSQKVDERKKEIESYVIRFKTMQMILFLFSVVFLIIGVVIAYKFHFPRKLFYFGAGILVVGGIIFVIGILRIPLLKYKIKNKKEALNDELGDLAQRISHLKRAKNTIAFKLNIAGYVLTKQFEVSDKISKRYQGAISLINNMRIWREDLIRRSKKLSDNSVDPFISLLKKDKLQQYFENHKDSITKDLHIWEFLIDHEVTEDGIINLKSKFIKAVESCVDGELEDFSVVDAMLNPNQYSFISDVDSNIITRMDSNSKVFFDIKLLDKNQQSHRVLLFGSSEEQRRSWKEAFKKYFEVSYLDSQTTAKDKIVLFTLQELNVDQI